MIKRRRSCEERRGENVIRKIGKVNRAKGTNKLSNGWSFGERRDIDGEKESQMIRESRVRGMNRGDNGGRRTSNKQVKCVA